MEEVTIRGWGVSGSIRNSDVFLGLVDCLFDSDDTHTETGQRGVMTGAWLIM